LKGLSLTSFKEPIKSQKKPRKINEKEKEGKEGARAGGRNAACEKIQSGAVHRVKWTWVMHTNNLHIQ
jgi:hypothetical protein